MTAYVVLLRRPKAPKSRLKREREHRFVVTASTPNEAVGKAEMFAGSLGLTVEPNSVWIPSELDGPIYLGPVIS